MPLLTVQQFREWRLYFEMEPWGAVGDDLQHSYTRKAMADAWGAKKPGTKRGPSMDDLSLMRLIDEGRMERRKERAKARRRAAGKPEEEEDQQQSVEEMKAILKGLAAYHNKGLEGQNARRRRPMRRRK